ncbi:uncharacterized mitochondrial protein AtMg00310-like [Juglans regia]|uniref:Uncharacterized mitochondrial protein AtMg00310-like n=1 Tax=Juglans regia TaxID=51240 RepID=A0A2I4DHG4_JUGRE|nr:uncharacterized mitochondrial protein AtMg00310-like [Juglans regia]
MSVFRFPKMLLKEIETMIAKLWWSHKKGGKGINWKCWNSLGTEKSMGGLGFHNLICFNRALLAKQEWRIIQEPSSLMAQIYKEKYFPTGHYVDAKLGYCPSQIWRSIWPVMDLVKVEFVWRVGNGKSVKVWKDKWVPIPSTFQIQSPITILEPNATGDVLIDEESKTWRKEHVHDVFRQEEAHCICSIPIRDRGWMIKLFGVYLTRGSFL